MYLTSVPSPNHIHPIPYFMKATGKYALDLRIGYAGKDCYRRKVALTPPVDIVYELVYEKDTFKPVKKGIGNEIESYQFEITSPFDRGAVIGGFGYIMYEDVRKNQLVIVTKADFDKSKKAAQSNTFWDNHPEQMQFKTLVHRTTSKIPIDPMKVNASFLHVEIDDVANGSERIIADKANQEFIDIEPEPDTTEPEATTRRDGVTGEQVITGNPDPGSKPGPPAPDDLEWG